MSSQSHLSDSVLCQHHLWNLNLIDLVDEEWLRDVLPEEGNN